MRTMVDEGDLTATSTATTRKNHVDTRTLLTTTTTANVTTTTTTTGAAIHQRSLQQLPNTVFLAGIFDTSSFWWGTDLFRWTIEMINDHSDGWGYDNWFLDDRLETPIWIEWQVADSACDEATATKAYFDILRHRRDEISNNNSSSSSNNNGTTAPVWHGIIGCRCSGASTAVARLVTADDPVVQISPSSTSSIFNDYADQFPYFKRTVAPDDEHGQVGAMVELLRAHGWDRVSIVSSDTDYGRGMATKFRRIWQQGGMDEFGNPSGDPWVGEVVDYQNIELTADGQVIANAAYQAFSSMPTDPREKSRVIVLMAHAQHAYPILNYANDIGFQPDTIWLGGEAWTDRLPSGSSFPHPGAYLGLTPFRNRDQNYHDFLTALQDRQRRQGYHEWTDLPDYAAEYMVDAILALTIALSTVSPVQRGNPDLISERIQDLGFDGVSGYVSFAPEGHRMNPKFSVYNIQTTFKDGVEGVEWKNIGTVGTRTGSFNQTSTACFVGMHCVWSSNAPSDKYPVPKDPVLPGWAVAILVILLVMLLALLIKYWRSRKSKKDKLAQIDSELDDIDTQLEKAKKRQELLVLRRAELKSKPSRWTDSTDILIEVLPTEAEYWDVNERLKASMNDAHISKLWRIQNDNLWAFYSFHRDRLLSLGVNDNERQVWHGTSSLEPSVIYNDKQDGFMMQYSREGFWGRGIYFADKSCYSHHYSYSPSPDTPHRKGAESNEREMFLSKLLIGNQTFIRREGKELYCSSLTVPPNDPATNMKYNTVAGHTGGSDVWIVYENGRAYPDYLVRYYKGSRDQQRTPFASRSTALSGKPQGQASATSFTATDIESGTPIWEYNGDSGWEAYGDSQQVQLEQGYQRFFDDVDSDSSIIIQGPEWKYRVDFAEMNQKNVEHGGQRVRSVRRVV